MSHTGNPRHPNNPPSDYPSEPTGLIAKDSLANESIRSGGAFGDNDNPEVIGVKGHQSTLANTDSSNAERLDPARSGAAREREEYADLPSKQRGAVGVKYPDAGASEGFDGVHSPEGYRGGSGDVSVPGGGTAGHSYTSGPGAGTGARPYVESAPGYTVDTTGDARNSGDLKPKGANLVEGGDIPPNRSTFTGDVGGPKDPGRLAEREFQKRNEDSSAGIARDYSSVGGDTAADGNQYDVLSSERA